MVAAVCSALLCFIGFPQVRDMVNEHLYGIGTVLGNFGTYFHYQSFVKGLFNLVDVIYALSMMALFILLNNIVVEARKYWMVRLCQESVAEYIDEKDLKNLGVNNHGG